jgi:hypothetical protein
LFEQGPDVSERSPDPCYLRCLIIRYVLTKLPSYVMFVVGNIQFEQSIIFMSREVRPVSQSEEHFLLSQFDQGIEQIGSLN